MMLKRSGPGVWVCCCRSGGVLFVVLGRGIARRNFALCEFQVSVAAARATAAGELIRSSVRLSGRTQGRVDCGTSRGG